MLQVSDLHCNCSFRNLFQRNSAAAQFAVLEEELPLANLTADRFQVCAYTRAAVLHGCSGTYSFPMQNNRKCTPTLHFQVYNYMRPEPGAVKDEPVGTSANPDRNSNPNPNPTILHPNSNWLHLYTLHQIEPDPQRHLYFKSAFLMSHPMGSWRTAQRQMGGLTPVAEVVAGLVADDTMVGLHVRTVFDAPRDAATARTALGEEAVRAAESEYGTEGAKRLMQWRKASHWSNFVPRIAALLQVQP